MENDYKKILHAYWKVFNTKEGNIVLEDLWKVVKRTSIDVKAIDRNKAVYRLAQESLLESIENKIEAYDKENT